MKIVGNPLHHAFQHELPHCFAERFKICSGLLLYHCLWHASPHSINSVASIYLTIGNWFGQLCKFSPLFCPEPGKAPGAFPVDEIGLRPFSAKKNMGHRASTIPGDLPSRKPRRPKTWLKEQALCNWSGCSWGFLLRVFNTLGQASFGSRPLLIQKIGTAQAHLRPAVDAHPTLGLLLGPRPPHLRAGAPNGPKPTPKSSPGEMYESAFLVATGRTSTGKRPHTKRLSFVR